MKKLIIVSLALAFIVSGCSLIKQKETVKLITPDEAKAQTADFINKNLVQAGNEVTIKDVSEEDGLYKMTIVMKNGQEIKSYLSKDGKRFYPQVISVDEVNQKAASAQADNVNTQAAKDIPKTDKPKAELFVMGFCPYGVQAETIMEPVVNLLGAKADIVVRYIASLTGDDLNSINSLHGVIEGKEDVRQLCVAKNYNQKTLWKYITAINKDCYSQYSKGEEVYNACWKKAAATAGVDAKKIESCFSSEGAKLIKADSALANSYGVSGSPTLLINGVNFNGNRTSEGYKQAICNAFSTQPKECQTKLSETGATASGDCAPTN